MKKNKLLHSLKEVFNNRPQQKNTGIDKLLIAAPLLLLALVVVFVVINLIVPKEEAAPVTDKLYNAYSNEKDFKSRVMGESHTPNMENEKTPENEEQPISIYGDSYCLSNNPRIASLAAYLSKYTNSRIVYNIAVENDTLEIMAGRIGGVPMYVSPCDIPADKKNVEITLKNEYGTNIVPDLTKNAGLNPCKINDIEGVIASENGRLYFSRSESGFEHIVTSSTPITTRAMELRLEDISVFFIGSDNMYNNPDRVVDIYTKATQALKSDKFLIIGPVSGKTTDIIAVNDALNQKFGEKYFNLFDYLCTDAISEYKLNLNDEDKQNAENKISVPKVLFQENENYFTENANEIIGNKIAQILKNLNYL